MVDTRNLSVMFTDIKGFTARTSQSTREDLVSLLKRHEEIVLPRVEHRGGTLIKTIGDAFLFTFESPTNAILAAVDVQRALGEYNRDVDAHHRIELRMGINAGEVTVIDGDVFGDAVNVASRIESAAEPNEVFFSEAVFLTLNRAELDAALRDNALKIAEVGPRAFKGVASRIRVYKIHPDERRSGGTLTLEFTEAAGDLHLALDSDRGPRRQAREELPLQPVGGLELDAPAVPTQPARPPTTRRPRTTSAPHSFWGRGGRIERALGWLGRFAPAAAALASLVGLLGVGAAVVLHSVWLTMAAVGFTVAVNPIHLGFAHGRMLVARAAGVLFAVAIVAAFAAMPMREVQRRIDGIHDTISSAENVELSFTDAAAAYVLNLWLVWRHASIGRPEAAREQMYMFVPGHPLRTFQSDFAMDSPAVVDKLAGFAGRLEVEWHRGSPEVRMAPVILRFKLASDGARLALALDPLTLSAVARRDPAGGWAIEATGSVPVEHGRGGTITLTEWGDKPVKLARSLAWALQERGWLHPYVAEWTWKLRDDDPRIALLGGRRAR